jgi:putative muconate cycloisomerase
MNTVHYTIRIIPRTLHFKQPAGTSRGIYTVRKCWFLHLTSDEKPGYTGIGECAPLPKLSCDDLPDYEAILKHACEQFTATGILDKEALRPYPSILFGLETALRNLETGSYALWDTPFSRGEAGIPINGLIWMGDYRKMLAQIEAKMQAGFRCIKLKIGAINFEEELALLQHIRVHFSSKEIELRVDANGAFSPLDAMDKLNRLAELDLHSIEQPIRAGQWEEMARLAASTPLPIALDEELIGCNNPADKKKLLTTIRPQYIILKPSLHGGINGGNEWIAEAEKQHIGWWITSALESNIGLNAIAQWCATFDNPLPQGLGTGALFTDNIEMPLCIRKDCLWYNP